MIIPAEIFILKVGMNEPHYIQKNIRAYYKRRLLFPLVFFVFLTVLSLFLPIRSLVFPKTVTATKDATKTIATAYEKNNVFVRANLRNLYFTGYTKDLFGVTEGYYYYTMLGDNCVVVLLTPETSEQGISTIDKLQISGKIRETGSAERLLFSHLAEDLSWSEQGISDTMFALMISEPDATNLPTTLLYLAVVLFVLYAAVSVLVYLLYIALPIFSPPVRSLRRFGASRAILRKAEKELATLPQLATDDMFITEHFFIETSSYGTAIVPIQDILWIYKYSTLHQIFGHHFSISYTLHITASKRFYIKCPKNTKTDIDGIIDYLSEANHNILVGFSEENRLKVEEKQGDSQFTQQVLTFLSRRV